MAEHYIYLADDALEEPVLLSEAIGGLAGVMLMSPNVAKISPPGDEEFAAWMWVLAGLKTGAATTFVQARLSRRWAKIPQTFWGECDAWGGPPTILRSSADPELRKQPIVVERGGLSAIQTIVWDALAIAYRGTAKVDAPFDIEEMRSRRGRAPGIGGYAREDAALVQEMRSLIEGGDAQSVWRAATMVCHKAKGATDDSKIRRLSNRYKDACPGPGR